jgi:hypothetical protein
MTVTEEQYARALERFKAARVAAGLPPLIEDEKTLRMIAAVISSSQARQRRRVSQVRRDK